MTIYEPARVLWWLDLKLSEVATAAGADGGAWRGAAPNTVPADTVVIIYDFDAGGDVANANADRLWTDCLYLVKVTGPRTKWDTVVAVWDALDTALQQQGRLVIGPNNDVRLMRCARETPVKIPDETINTTVQSSIGALWRIYARSIVG